MHNPQARFPIVVELPVKLSLRKTQDLSLNRILRLNRFDKEKVKNAFNAKVMPLLPDNLKLKKINIIYFLHLPLKGRALCQADLTNYTSVADKFFQDCLVKKQIIKDDNHRISKSIQVFLGAKTEKPPYITAVVREHNQSSEDKYLSSIGCDVF